MMNNEEAIHLQEIVGLLNEYVSLNAELEQVIDSLSEIESKKDSIIARLEERHQKELELYRIYEEKYGKSIDKLFSPEFIQDVNAFLFKDHTQNIIDALSEKIMQLKS